MTPSMNHLPLVLAIAGAALADPAAAGERPGTDLFAGYSFARVADVSRHGGNVAAGFDLLGPVDAFVDASAHWGSDASVGRSDLTLMAGPGFRVGRRGRTVFFLRAMAGVARDSTSITVLDVDIGESESHFAILAGGGVDVRVGRRLAIRAQGDYLWRDLPEGIASPVPGGPGTVETPSDFRASAGIVYRFGIAP